MTKTVLDVITIDQLRALKEAGFVVVHREPTLRMLSSSSRKGEWPEDRSNGQVYHRMVGESIKIQNEEMSR